MSWCGVRCRPDCVSSTHTRRVVPRIYTQVFSRTALWAGNFFKIFARCARRQIFNQIFENIGLPQAESLPNRALGSRIVDTSVTMCRVCVRCDYVSAACERGAAARPPCARLCVYKTSIWVSELSPSSRRNASRVRREMCCG